MKCRYCGGEIQLEDLVCPYCGRPNEEAQQHARDMRRYQREFQKTKMDVTEKAGHASKRAVQIAAIVSLIAAIVVNIFLQANCYNISYAIERSRAKKNIPAHLQQMDRYLSEEDYAGFAAYCQAKHLSMLDKTFDPYYATYRTAVSYRTAVMQMMELVHHMSYTTVDRMTKYLTEDIQNFYENLDPEQYSYYDYFDDENTQKHLANMKTHMEAMFVAYLGMTPEEAAGMETLSRAGQAALIERGTAQYEEGEESNEK
ncbi:MAG: hypothetical protein IJJ50_03090 [Lachnospiraceae bacterium]|nr:hypothetical protein [Lachnospiraceae bacterium]